MLISSLIAIAIAYIIGSTPIGLWVAKFVKGVDIRKEGSGNIGATNVGRVLGLKWFFIVTLLDALKGALPVLILPWWFLDASQASLIPHLQIFCGMASVAGHMFPFWLKFKGGKGVATALGVILIVGPTATASAVLMFLIVFGFSRMISLSSMLAAVTYAVVSIVSLMPNPFSALNWSVSLFAIAIPLLIIYQHRSNIKRLWKGEENVIGKKKNDS